MTRIKQLLIGRNPRKTLLRAFLLAILSFLVFGLIARPVRIQGISMEPTLKNGSIHFINMIKFYRSEPARGDMVAVALPGGRAYYLKRIIGLPGETIAFDHGTLIINDKVMAEPYISRQGRWRLEPTPIPDHTFFVAGDNRETSFAGHTLGLVERGKISGVLFR